MNKIEELFKIKLEGELKEILNYCKEEPVFFDDDKRLLSIEEILNYRQELGIENDNIIPIIDFSDNDFLGFDILNNQFVKFYIVEEFVWERLNSIQEYITSLEKHFKKSSD